MGLVAITEQIINYRPVGKEIPARKRWGLSLKDHGRPNSWSQVMVLHDKYCSAVCNKNFFPI